MTKIRSKRQRLNLKPKLRQKGGQGMKTQTWKQKVNRSERRRQDLWFTDSETQWVQAVSTVPQPEPADDEEHWVTRWHDVMMILTYRQCHSTMLSKQDGDYPGKSFHAWYWRQLPPVDWPVLLPLVQRHSHHGRHVLQHLRHRTRGMHR